MNAGTDANVFIIIYGKSGRTTIHKLDNLKKNYTSQIFLFEDEVKKLKVTNQLKANEFEAQLI